MEGLTKGIDLIGIVLCGGESSRMGTDKGLILLGNKPWVTLIVEKLESLKLRVLVSINSSQKEKYLKFFAEIQLIIDDAEVKGPVRGLLSAHKKFPKQNILLMACDLLDIQRNALENVISIFTNEPGFDFYCSHHDGFYEPFCGIYTSAGLKKVLDQAQSGDLHNYSFQHMLSNGNTKKIVPFNLAEFKNRNFPE